MTTLCPSNQGQEIGCSKFSLGMKVKYLIVDFLFRNMSEDRCISEITKNDLIDVISSDMDI